MPRIIIFYLLSLLIGCQDSPKHKLNQAQKKAIEENKTDTQFIRKPTVISAEEINERGYEEKERTDSARLLKVFQRAMAYAEKNKNKISFQHEFEMKPDETSYIVATTMHYGNLFARDKKHLFIKRTVPWGTICDVFLLKKKRFTKVCERQQGGLEYLTDTLGDVNGDNFNDLLLHWYPPSGCCRRDVYTVYLYQPKSGGFTTDYEFINPSFFPHEKIIRGVGYGHPGEVPLYKYKWNGLKVDTIEYLFPDKTTKNQFYITRSMDWDPSQKSSYKKIKNLPKEYQHIRSIEWFLDY